MSKTTTRDAAALPLDPAADESSQIRVLSSELRQEALRRRQRARAKPLDPVVHEPSGASVRDTIPCAPPSEPARRPPDLERTLRFAELVRDTLPRAQGTTQLLDMAIQRRDGALLQAILKHLHDQQQRDQEALEDAVDPAEHSGRPTILPPPPDPARVTSASKRRR